MSRFAVRRGVMSQPATFTPTQISGLLAWFKADALSLADGASVDSWTDSSPAGRHATQTGVQRPTYKTGIVNSKPVIRFDKTDDSLSTAAFAQPAEWTFFAVCQATNTTGTQTVASTDDSVGGNRHGQLMRVTTVAQALAFNTVPTAFNDTETATPTNWNVLTALRSASAIEVFVNGTSGGSTATTGTNATPTVAVRIGANPTGAANFFGGDIAELIYYDSALSSGNRTLVRQYLGTKYGITVS